MNCINLVKIIDFINQNDFTGYIPFTSDIDFMNYSDSIGFIEYFVFAGQIGWFYRINLIGFIKILIGFLDLVRFNG